MANSMDTILVKYGVSLSYEEKKLVEFPSWDEEDKKKAEELKSKIKTVTVPEFLAIKPENLSEAERKIQRAIQMVYDLNEKDPPLFREFPIFESLRPALNIDITTAGNNKGDYAAAYSPLDNKVVFEMVNDPDLLIETLTHELKHAEQHDEESWHASESAYAHHQREFLYEAQAYTAGERAYYELFGTAGTSRKGILTYAEIAKKYTDSNGNMDIRKIEEEMVKHHLDRLFNEEDGYYKNQYDLSHPIGENDEGLEKIPEALHLPEYLMGEVNKAPRVAKFLNGKLLQAQKNGKIDEYIKLLHEGISKDEKITSADFGFICEKASVEQIQDMLSIKTSDNKYLFNTETIRTSISYSKTSTEAMKYLLTATRDGEKIVNTKTIIDALRSKKTPEELREFVTSIQDDKENLPITEKDCISENFGVKINDLACIFLSDKNVLSAAPTLFEISKLKGKDGKPLVSPKVMVEKLAHSYNDLKPESVQKMFDAFTDEKGHLVFSRDLFDIRNSEYEREIGQNLLLTEMRNFSKESKKNSLAILPILMALKDKDGKPIISQENIDRFPEYSDLASAVKAYKRTSGIKQAMKTKAKAGAKKLEQNPEGYVRRKTKKKQKSIKTPSVLKKDNHTL